MKRCFNTAGSCNPQKHYMVKLDERLQEIKEQFVDPGSYFCINRGRQYGKTTTLRALEEYLKPDYVVLFLDFQWLSAAGFADEKVFTKAFIKRFSIALDKVGLEGGKMLLEPLLALEQDAGDNCMVELFIRLGRLCENIGKSVVMMIDEVDSAGNSQVFIDFLSLLRGAYLDRENTATFHAVILAGVYDIKNMKQKLRPDEEHQYNSPWNIAAEFDVEMNFTIAQIAGMLQEYEMDSHTGMDTEAVATEIYQYTMGYPYLVSAICKIIDEKLPNQEKQADKKAVWSTEAVREAVKLLLKEKQPLFDSMIKQIWKYPDIKNMLHAILFQGRRVSYNPDTPVINLAQMFGYVTEREGCVQVANRVFEMRLYNLFLSEAELANAINDRVQKNTSQFIRNGKLNMDLVLEKFVEYFTDIYGGNDERFVEEEGRKFFLLYLKPIINGVGNYYIEARTRDAMRTDVVVDYLGEQYVVELKIWHGNAYNERGERQLLDYLDAYHLEKGYMLSFNFNLKKETGIKEIRLGEKVLVEAVV